jgi:hypothetical protein
LNAQRLDGQDLYHADLCQNSAQNRGQSITK